MIGILLFWLAFSPVQPVPERPPVSQKELLQHKKESTGHQQKSVVTNSVTGHIRRFFDRLLQPNTLSELAEQKFINPHLARFYAARGFQPVWIKPLMVSELISAVEGAVNDGLEPSDYHINEIREFQSHPSLTPESQARYDILLSDAYFTFASHLRYGKVEPKKLDQNWNLNNTVSRSALEYRLEHALINERIAVLLNDLHPQYPKYNKLKAVLARYRSIAREGGWPVLPEGPTLTEGSRDNRVLLLHKRLEASGEIGSSESDTSKVYTKELVEAVKKFQKRNGLDPDGAFGAVTVKVMNMPVERRIDQIRINLERYRWFLSELEPTYVIVNIPEFALQYIVNGNTRWATRVIVGQPARKTPVFKAEMQYVIFNPQWVIPPTILAKDALPGIRKSISYLSHKKLNVIDRNGSIVDPASVNWSQYTEKNFPYRLRQLSGEHGSLGRVKFLLPNRFIVYLHDTPTKELFKKSARAFSSGCIRVENPLELAEQVLQDSIKWNRDRIMSVIKTKKTSTVILPKRIPVFILYLTAVADGEDIQFFEDVYDRDTAVLNALNKPLSK
jgi:L,D-transpeptidase YcbB